MARTIGEAITEVRRLLVDSGDPNANIPYRYTENHLYSVFNMAMTECRRLRPDIFIGGYLNPFPSYTIANAADPFPIEEFYFTPVVNFVAGYAELIDDEFAVDGRAATLLKLFAGALVGRGGI